MHSLTNLNKENTRIIIGNPGCGKTTKLIFELAQAIQEGVKLSKIGFCSFSVAAIDEAKTRALAYLNGSAKRRLSTKDLPYFKTLHAMAFQLLGLSPHNLLTDYTLKDFGKLVDLPFSKDTRSITQKGDKVLQIINSARLQDMSIRDYMIENDLHDFTVRYIEDIAERYLDFKIVNSYYDYTDMLVMAKTADIDTPELEILFVDEAQDLSTLQWLLVNRLAKTSKKIVIAGDDKQCQPPGSKVLTTTGFKNIEDLDEKTDKLIAYDKRGAQCYGGYSFKKEEHTHVGDLYTLRTRRGATRVTDGHINLVKWNNKDLSKNVVYLMQRGNYFRVGWCQLFSSNGSLHLGERRNKEKADRTWVLKVCNSKKEASIYESILAAKYGLPLVPFEPVYGSNYYDREGLTQIFESIPNQREKAERLLKDVGKDITDPFLQAGKQNRHGSTIFECTTRNLIPKLMLLPHMITSRNIEWEQVQSITVQKYSGTVYGLDVEKRHTYITDDNIITHNCINSFAGADVDTFLAIDGKVETLEQSYRVPNKVFQMANTITQYMSKYRKEGAIWKPRKEEGSVTRCSSFPLLQLFNGEWLVLARASYQLNSIADKLLQASEDGAILFSVNGEPPIDMELFRAITLFKLSKQKKIPSLVEMATLSDSDDAALRKTKISYIKLFKKFISCSPGQPWQVDEDFLTSLHLTWDEAFDKVPNYIKRYAARVYPLFVKDEHLFENAKIKLMTIHAAKGREADNVIVYMDVPRTVKENVMRKDTDIEAKVLYVAVTRAKKKLFLWGREQERMSLAKYTK